MVNGNCSRLLVDNYPFVVFRQADPKQISDVVCRFSIMINHIQHMVYFIIKKTYAQRH